jgi:hypothetical protein
MGCLNYFLLGIKIPQSTTASVKDSAHPFRLQAAGRKKLTAAFDGGQITSDGGNLLLTQAELAGRR